MPDAAARDDEALHGRSDDEERVHPLLEIQQLDTETEQLQHRRATLPQRQELSASRAKQSELQRQIDTVALQRIDVLSRQKRLEDEAATIQAKADVDDSRLYSGEITASRDLQVLQEEIKGLRSRQGALEEQAIEALLEAEEFSEQADSLEAQRTASEERVTVLEAELAAAEATIHQQLVALAAARTEASARVESAALAKYEGLRQTFGPSTAVAFDPTSGCGCPDHMPNVEVARIKRCTKGEVLDCTECGRLVLR